MDFATPGFEASDATLISSTLVSVVSAEIAKQNLRVISKADIIAMLSFEEMKTALACEEGASCLAEIGGALGTDMLLSGTVSKLGGVMRLTMTLIDIETAQVRARFSGEAGSIGVLPDTAKRGVAVLFERAVDAAGVGTLFVKTKPAHALVLVDGKEVGRSPVTVDDVRAGDHLVSARKDGLFVEKRVLVEAQGIAKLELDLAETPPVALKVLSTPPEAEVFLDGKKVGETPLVLKEVAAGERELRVKLQDHAEETRRVMLSYDAWDRGGRAPFKEEFELKLAPVSLVLEGLAAGSVVLVDGAEASARSEQAPGVHLVEITAPGYETVKKEVVLDVGAPKTVAIEQAYTEAYADYLAASALGRGLFSTGAWVGGVAAALGAATLGAAFGLNVVAEGAYADYLAATDPAEIERSYGQVETFAGAAQTTELAGYGALAVAGVGVALAVTGAVLTPTNPVEVE
jgi:hypothetical protein